MIVRVSTEGQYELKDGALERMHELDDACQAAVEAGDGERFHGCYEQLLELIRERRLGAGGRRSEGLGSDTAAAGHNAAGSAERVLRTRVDP